MPDAYSIIYNNVMRRVARKNQKRELVRWIDKRLLDEYGDRVRPARAPDPLDVLVLTVLSQNTNDVNRDRAYKALRDKFPTWQDVLDAPVKEIEEAIRVGGLAAQKSGRIKKMLSEIVKREGRLDLRRLCRMERGEALDYLYSFKGVGDKTAAIVMLFSCGEPVFPVDTHIHRLTRRLGLVGMKDDAGRAHEIMGELVPAELMLRLHINLIEHGRKVCHPRKPECGNCCLSKRCPSAFKV